MTDVFKDLAYARAAVESELAGLRCEWEESLAIQLRVRARVSALLPSALPVMSVNAIAVRLGVSRQTLYNWMPK